MSPFREEFLFVNEACMTRLIRRLINVFDSLHLLVAR